MRLAGHVVSMEGKRSEFNVFVGYSEGSQQEYLHRNRIIILKLILE
jgi:hypothetical protein